MRPLLDLTVLLTTSVVTGILENISLNVSRVEPNPKQTFYLVGCLLVSLCILLETRLLNKNQGKPPKNVLFSVCAVADFAWFIVSIASFYVIALTGLLKILPWLYIIFTVFGWGYGIFLLKDQADTTAVKDIRIPRQYISYSQSFALVFFCLTLVLCGLNLID